MVHTVHHNIVHHTVVLSTVASRNWQEKASWLDFQRRGLERRRQDDDVEDVHASNDHEIMLVTPNLVILVHA